MLVKYLLRFANNTLIKMVIILSLLFNMSLGASVVADPTNQMPEVKPEMMDPEFWIAKLQNQDQIIMQGQEIAAFNCAVIEKLPNQVYDLKAYPQSIPGVDLKNMIERPFPEDPMYIGAQQLSSSYLGELNKKTNISSIKDKNAIQYAFTVRRTNLREFPTADIVSDEINDLEFDLFQDTAILPFEPLILLHQSSDKEWYFAQAYNYSGWVSARDLALNPERENWLAYQRSSRFLLVSGNRIILSQNPYTAELSELELPMGTVLPLAELREIPALIDGQAPSGNYVVKLPVRKEDGKTAYKLALVPYSADVHQGFLPYTRAAIIRQAFKMQGDRYGWGGMLGGRDCSSLIQDVYRCFGFYLPRDSEDQAASAGMTLSLDGYSINDRSDLLNQMLPGASLHFPGHTMLYLGEEAGRYYVISALGNWGRIQTGSEPQSVRVHGVVVNNLNLTRKNTKTWLESLTIAKQYEKVRFNDLDKRNDQAIIESLAEQYIISGKGNNEFEPDAIITRAEFSAILVRALRLAQDESGTAFKDSDGWFAGYVGAVAKAGLLTGYNREAFNPLAPISRAELAVVLAKAMGGAQDQESALNEDILKNYKDNNEVPSWARKSVADVIKAGLLNVEGNEMHPNANVTRAEAAVCISRLLKKQS